MDQALANALKRQRDLKLELAKVEQFISMYEELSGTKVQRDEMLSTSSVEVVPSPEPQRSFMPKQRNVPRRIVRAAKKALETAGHPLTRGELVERVEEMGYEIHSEDKPRYIGTLMWRNEEMFENIEGRGYWLKGVPLPQDDSALPLGN
jgi:hypothetical protein